MDLQIIGELTTDGRVSLAELCEMFAVMVAASWHSFQVLTKRPERLLDLARRCDGHPTSGSA